MSESNPELGWDCIVAIGTTEIVCVKEYTSSEVEPETREEALEYIDVNNLIITDKTLTL